MSSVNDLLKNQLNKLFEKPDTLPDVSQRTETPAAEAAPPAAAAPATPAPETPKAAAPADSNYDRLAREAEGTKKELAEMKKLLAQLGKGPEAPAPRATVRAVGDDVADLRTQLLDMQDIMRIERDLPGLPEYASLKNIPDLSRVVLAETRKLQQDARERGEGEVEVSAAAVLKSFKENFVSNLKRHLNNPDLVQELGLSATKPPTERTVTSRALTSDLGSSGSQGNKPASSVAELVHNQMLKAARAINGG